MSTIFNILFMIPMPNADLMDLWLKILHIVHLKTLNQLLMAQNMIMT